jgi:hypothetical protein
MVDQQTPPVRSEEELERDDAPSRDAQARRDDAGDLEVEANRAAQADTPPPEAGSPAPDASTREADVERKIRADVAAARSSDARPAANAANDPALFDTDTSKGYQDRWLVIQTEFVDSPKAAVQKAEQLVGEVMTELTESFSRQRQNLEAGWSKADDASTEDLRQAIRRYRSFFNRLLAI